MLKKTFSIIILILLPSCGYEAIHSKKNAIGYDFSINKIDFIGDRDINSRIKKKLASYTLDKREKDFVLNISSSSEKIIISKDISGSVTSFKTKVTIDVKVLLDNVEKDNLQIIENFKYSNNTNNFDLKRYEKEIKINLAETASNKLIFKLSNIQ